MSSIGESVMEIGKNTVNLGLDVTKNTIKTADNAQDLAFDLTQNTLQTVNQAQNTAFKLTQNALTITKSAGKTTSDLVDASLIATSDIGKTGLSQGTVVAKSSMEQTSKIAVAALEFTGDTTKQTIQTVGRAATNVFSTVDNALIKSKIVLDAKREANYSKTNEQKKKAVIGITEQLFSDNVQALANSLSDFISDNQSMIQNLIKMLKSNKCKPGYFSTKCEDNVLEFITSINRQLTNLTAFSKQNIERLKGLKKKLKGKIVPLYNLDVTDETLFQMMNAELKILLSPFYVEASSIFERTITEFEDLIEKITKSIRSQVLNEIPTTISSPVIQSPTPLLLPPSQESMGQLVPYVNKTTIEIDGGQQKKRNVGRKTKKSKKNKRRK